MAKKLTIFYIYKMKISAIIENNYTISTTFDEAKKRGWIVGIGDNQLLKFIRDIKCIDFDKQIDKLEQLYKYRDSLKAQPKNYENSQLILDYQKQINNILYIPDIISVQADTIKSDYLNVCNNKFTVNNITYKRLCAGAGQLRRNTVLFINEILYDQLMEIMLCGLNTKRIGKINLAKFSAYHSLYSSSTNTISTPRVCVVKDLEIILPKQKIDWIYETENKERNIEEKIIDVKQNVWDGSGLVSLEMADKWNEDLGIEDYTPSAYIVRSAWIKGLCIRFDWKRFATEVAHKDYIIDAWGNKKDINNIDVVLTTSQFKMWKKYNDWEEYIEYHTKYNHVWGCSRINKKEDDFLTPLNYQYIQSNSFTPESIKKLANFSVEWIKKVASGKRIYVLLYLLGSYHDKSIEEIEKETGMNIVKALMYNDKILDDPYVRQKIYKSLEKKITQLKIGKLLVEGSYEFAITDPYMMCEYIFGLAPKGLLQAEQVWNRRWVDKGSKEIAIMRSPLVSPNENNVLSVHTDQKCEEWFSEIKSGVVLNAWDTSLMRASDGDMDGDLLLSTDNEYILTAVNRCLNPITYEKTIVKEQSLTYKNLSKMDTKSFNAKIGFITNLATSFIGLREQYEPNTDEYKELTKRINLLRFHQGSAIDAGKGNVFIPPPKVWSKKLKIDYKTDEPEVIKHKRFINRLTGNKKLYFMCHIYPSLMKEYKSHKETYKRICRAMFGCRFDELLKKGKYTDKEKKFIRNYYRYLPVKVNKSIMNQLAWYIEDIDFDLKFFKKEKEFDYTILMDSTYKVNSDSKIYKKILNVLKKYHRIYELNVHEKRNMIETFDYYEEDEDDQELSFLCNEIENELLALCSNKLELADYMISIAYNELKNKSKSILWNVCGEQVVENLKRKSEKGYYPIETTPDDYDSYEYLGKYYKLQEENIFDNI